MVASTPMDGVSKLFVSFDKNAKMARTEVEAKKLCKVVKSLAADSDKVSVLKWKGQVSWSWLPIAKVVVDAQHEPTEL
eukprot:1090700-Karenia_brevis.AAC.1